MKAIIAVIAAFAAAMVSAGACAAASGDDTTETTVVVDRVAPAAATAPVNGLNIPEIFRRTNEGVVEITDTKSTLWLSRLILTARAPALAHLAFRRRLAPCA